MSSDKAYSAESRLNALIGSLPPLIGPASDQTVNAAYPVQIGNLAYTIPSGGGVYHVRAKIVAAQGTSAGGQGQLVGLSGPAINWARLVYTDTELGTPPILEHQLPETSLASYGTAAYTTGTIWESRMEGNISFSAGGTFALNGGEVGGVTWTAKGLYCYLWAIPGSPV